MNNFVIFPLILFRTHTRSVSRESERQERGTLNVATSLCLISSAANSSDESAGEREHYELGQIVWR